MCIRDRDRLASRLIPSNLKLVTRWIGPAAVETGEMDDESIRPNIISLVLDVSLSTVQLSNELR